MRVLAEMGWSKQEKTLSKISVHLVASFFIMKINTCLRYYCCTIENSVSIWLMPKDISGGGFVDYETNTIPQANIDFRNEKEYHQRYADFRERFILF